MKNALLALGLLLLSGALNAATTPSEAIAERESALSAGFYPLAVFLADTTQRGAGFMTGAHEFSPLTVRKKFGFNLGVDLGGSFTSIDKESATRVSSAQQVKDLADSLPVVLPVPLGGANLHFGLPSPLFFETFEVGLHVHGLGIEAGNVSLSLSSVGLDLRGNVFEAGPSSPVTLSLGLGVDRMSGKLAIKNSQYINDSSTVPGYAISGTITGSVEMNMEDTAYAIRAVVSRKFLFVTPYLGVAAQINDGSSDVSLGQVGKVTATGPGGPPATGGDAVGRSLSPIAAMDMRLGGGLEFSFGPVYLSLNGEYGVVSGGYGGSAQLGFTFR